jgi:MerR family transcriptional regulator, copper efflux regulator
MGYRESMDELTIGALAREAGVTPEAARYYERVGVLEPARRTEQGHRRYGPRVLEELRLLRSAQALGFSLGEIGRMLSLTRQDPVPCDSMCELVANQVAELDERIGHLRGARERLASALAACDHEESCVVAARLVLEPPGTGPAPRGNVLPS